MHKNESSQIIDSISTSYRKYTNDKYISTDNLTDIGMMMLRIISLLAAVDKREREMHH